MSKKETNHGYSHVKYTWMEGNIPCEVTLHMLDSFSRLYPHVQDAQRTQMSYTYDRYDVLRWREGNTQ